jgi:hypothetical protein
VKHAAHPVRHPAGSDAGMLLLECLMYVAILAIVVNLVASVFVSATRLSAVGTAALDRVNAVDDVREAFTRAVREAEAVVPGAGAFATGPNQLVLRMPLGAHKDAHARYVVLGCIDPAPGFKSLEITEKNGQYAPEAYTVCSLPVQSLRFDYGAGPPERARLISLDVVAANARKDKDPTTYRLTGALRSTERRSEGGAKP